MCKRPVLLETKNWTKPFGRKTHCLSREFVKFNSNANNSASDGNVGHRWGHVTTQRCWTSLSFSVALILPSFCSYLSLLILFCLINIFRYNFSKKNCPSVSQCYSHCQVDAQANRQMWRMFPIIYQLLFDGWASGMLRPENLSICFTVLFASPSRRKGNERIWRMFPINASCTSVVVLRLRWDRSTPAEVVIRFHGIFFSNFGILTIHKKTIVKIIFRFPKEVCSGLYPRWIDLVDQNQLGLCRETYTGSKFFGFYIRETNES